jgi:hypothetical protein
MRPQKLAILLLLTTVPVLAQTDALASHVAATSPVFHAPRKSLGPALNQLGDNTRIYESSNWAGYAVVGASFTHASGSWVVPTVDCSVTPIASASFWVGIDGWNDYTVEQTGTDSDCNSGIPAYYAWYEFFPKGGVTITSVPVSPGDDMSASVDYNGSEFTVTTTDLTTGESFSTSLAVPGAQRESAEWIAEFNGNLLSDFGTVEFGPDFTKAGGTNDAIDATASGPISAFGSRVQASVMVASKDVDEAVPSLISTDGTSFTVNWWAK